MAPEPAPSSAIIPEGQPYARAVVEEPVPACAAGGEPAAATAVVKRVVGGFGRTECDLVHQLRGAAPGAADLDPDPHFEELPDGRMPIACGWNVIAHVQFCS